MIQQALIERIRHQFRLDWDGIHGLAHWERVRRNGLAVAEQSGANPEVVTFFALLHDSRRASDGDDPKHGLRAAQFAKTLRKEYILLPDTAFEQLIYACTYHSDGLQEADLTIQTCWDADRLDLWRVGLRPQARYLCTEAAKQPAMIEWAVRQSESYQAVDRFADLSLEAIARPRKPWWKFL